MSIIKEIILNIVLVVFPILVYFIYNCYRELKCEKYNGILFNLSLFSSLYLCLKYGYNQSNIQIYLFCNIPILIAYLKKETLVAQILSLMILLYTKYILNQTIIFMTIKFISYLIIYLIGRKRNIKDKNFITIISILQGFYTSTEIFYNTNNNLTTIISIVLSVLIFYLLPFILLYLFKLTDTISSLYLTAREFEKEKQLKNSLFKITHEVKNPIAVCKGYLEMLDINKQDKVKKYIPIIKQEINRSLNIMSDFMEFSKINIEKEVLDINVLLEDIIEELSIIIKNNNIKISSKITKDEIYIEGDYNRLKQVFINILKNSVESISSKGNINIITHTLKDKYFIEIEDTGCGMDEYTLSKVKDLFFTTKSNGSGLGVSLSNEIIKAHNGSIDYISKKGKGTKVVVKLPILMI